MRQRHVDLRAFATDFLQLTGRRFDLVATKLDFQWTDDRHRQGDVRGQRLDQRRKLGWRPRPVKNEVVARIPVPQRAHACLAIGDVPRRIAVRPGFHAAAIAGGVTPGREPDVARK